MKTAISDSFLSINENTEENPGYQPRLVTIQGFFFWLFQGLLLPDPEMLGKSVSHGNYEFHDTYILFQTLADKIKHRKEPGLSSSSLITIWSLAAEIRSNFCIEKEKEEIITVEKDMRLHKELEWRYTNIPTLSGSVPPGTPHLPLAS